MMEKKLKGIPGHAHLDEMRRIMADNADIHRRIESARRHRASKLELPNTTIKRWTELFPDVPEIAMKSDARMPSLPRLESVLEGNQAANEGYMKAFALSHGVVDREEDKAFTGFMDSARDYIADCEAQERARVEQVKNAALVRKRKITPDKGPLAAALREVMSRRWVRSGVAGFVISDTKRDRMQPLTLNKVLQTFDLTNAAMVEKLFDGSQPPACATEAQQKEIWLYVEELLALLGATKGEKNGERNEVGDVRRAFDQMCAPPEIQVNEEAEIAPDAKKKVAKREATS